MALFKKVFFVLSLLAMSSQSMAKHFVEKLDLQGMYDYLAEALETDMSLEKYCEGKGRQELDSIKNCEKVCKNVIECRDLRITCQPVSPGYAQECRKSIISNRKQAYCENQNGSCSALDGASKEKLRKKVDHIENELTELLKQVDELQKQLGEQ